MDKPKKKAITGSMSSDEVAKINIHNQACDDWEKWLDPCHICGKSKNMVGSEFCSYPHPISREVFDKALHEEGLG